MAPLTRILSLNITSSEQLTVSSSICLKLYILLTLLVAWNNSSEIRPPISRNVKIKRSINDPSNGGPSDQPEVNLLNHSYIQFHKTNQTICFHSNHASERGTEVSMYDYAHFCEIYYGYKSIIIFPNLPGTVHGLGLPRFKARFPVHLYDVIPKKLHTGGPNLVNLSLTLQCDMLYMQNAGTKHDAPTYETTFLPPTIPMVKHAVFHWEAHGAGYAAISPDVTLGQPDRAIVPYMVRSVDMKAFLARKGMRKELGIEEKTLVLCRYGGRDSFDVDIAHHTVWEMVEKYTAKQLIFLFVNTDKFSNPRNRKQSEHPQIRHLPGMVEEEKKEEFLRTCDAMIHARIIGESFGLAIAEFSVHNIPVITFPGKSQEHIRILGKKGFPFENVSQLITIIDTFVTHGIPHKYQGYNAYGNYSQQIVMGLFKEHFLNPVFGEDGQKAWKNRRKMVEVSV